MLGVKSIQLCHCQHLYWKVVTADQGPNNVFVIVFFTRHYSEDEACGLLWSFRPERAIPKERSLLQKVPLSVNVIAVWRKIQTACSAACSAAWSETDLVSSELSWAGALALKVPLALFALWAVCEGAGIPQLTDWGWMVRSDLYSNLLSLSHSLCTWSKMLGCWKRVEVHNQKLKTAQRICF